MTATTIQRWLFEVPDEALSHLVLGKRISGPASKSLTDSPAADWDSQRFAMSYRYPDFGWRFVAVLAKFGLPFPTCLEEQDRVLWRAYLLHCNQELYRDPALLQAMGLMHEDLTMQRDTVNGMLLANDIGLEDIAKILGLETPVLKIYERLFFNVIDRKHDAMYIQGIVYPRGRLEEFMQGYLQTTTARSMMMRAGVNNGVEHVMYHGGINNDLVHNLAAASSSEQMESMIMAQGYVMARAGLLNQDPASVPGILHSQRLIAAGKVGGEDTGMESEISGWGISIRDELKGYGNEQLTRLQNAMEAGHVIDVDADMMQAAGEEVAENIDN